ncbi:HNH endonuclease [Jiangella alkaliphila]|uniref:HNH endonuclease n=1 Tax=Jiangella alkaliphila TaxID=419479 RepID=A0A1H2L625_9ACTN|nr:HNH endonuclease [Jiangella alkaliphila]
MAPLAAPNPAADGTPDPRGHATRMGDALIELCRRGLDHGDLLPGARGARPHITVIASLPTLRRQPGCPKAVSMWGTPITPEALRRLACDAGVSRVLTDPAGVPLDVGRQYRTVTPAQWVALVARDKGCAFPGCSRPAAWTQAHHVKHWADGGATDLNNLVLLCGHHHRSVHHRGWTVRVGADGQPEFLPPPWIDPGRQPRRNTYHRVVDAVGTDPLSLTVPSALRRAGPPRHPPDHVQAA